LCNIQLLYAYLNVKQKYHTTPCHYKSFLFPPTPAVNYAYFQYHRDGSQVISAAALTTAIADSPFILIIFTQTKGTGQFFLQE
jgi:hypothetical protein